MKSVLQVVMFLVLSFAAVAHAQTKVIKIDGSDTVYPITEAMSEEFQKDKKGSVNVTIGVSGTGGGFKKFCRGETDISDASRPITKSEMDDCKAAQIKYFEIPIAFDATVVAVNAKNNWLNEISVADLKTIWQSAAQGKIKNWNQVNPKWPNAEIKLYGSGPGSGTFDFFTEAINGKAKESRGDYTASKDYNTLVKGIAGDQYALGYIPLAYFEENQKILKALAILGGEKAPTKKAVLPSKKTVEDNTYFPLARPLFIYVSEAAAKKPEVNEFVKFYLAHARSVVPAANYIALPAKIYELGTEHYSKGKLGTVFGTGSNIGLKIDELMKKETTF